MDKPAKRIVMIVGPTAVGKSDLGVYLAQQLHGEVINGDAYQIYRHMDIGTAKITPKEMQGVPHHLLDIADPTVAYSVAKFKLFAIIPRAARVARVYGEHYRAYRGANQQPSDELSAE